ncbi:hypothetical protein HHK36_012774 [Tetracentron sinense]|uniref:Uncharacterized protein n=1 Tax=Tetracentron sinense TaxID=13715 RepID=A0A834ZB02_TETSI|nr:hypothetical protein HHK36_012774 [Tetracentron sinense]
MHRCSNSNEMGIEDKSWAKEEGLPGQDGVVELSAEFTKEDEMSKLVSVVRASTEKELSLPLEVGDSLEVRDNQFSDMENSQEGSSDEEGLWRMQVAASEVKDDNLVELEKCATCSNDMEAGVGSSQRREILANVAKSVEVSKVLGLRGLGRGERRLDVRGLLRKIKPDLIAFQETKLKEMNDLVVSEVWDNRQVDWVFVESMGASGGQLVMWDRLVHEKAFGWAYVGNRHNTWEQFYVYWICPFIGAILAAWVFRVIFPPPVKQKKA